MMFHSTLGHITSCNDVLLSFLSSIGGNVCGNPSDVLNEAMVNKVEINLILSSLRQNRKKVKEFQQGRTDINFEQLDNDDIVINNVPFMDDCSHVLIFNQKESGQLDEMIVRSFL